MKFSIITVCLNAEKEIGATIQSIVDQTDTEFEYLIKDGGSKDGTVHLAESFRPTFEKRGIPYRILSESDKGIYDAMNQAVREARGKWLIFMNAGDLMARADVLQSVKDSGALIDSDVVYGDTIVCDQEWYMLKKGNPVDTIRNSIPFFHQSVFTRKELFAQGGYSLQYRICSDYLFYLQRYLEGNRFVYLPLTISIFDKQGVSSNGKLATQERIRLHEELGVADAQTLPALRKRLKHIERQEFIHRHITRFLPEQLLIRRRVRRKIAEGWKRREAFEEQTK